MGRRPRLSFKQKLSVVNDYLEGKKSTRELARENNVDRSSVEHWIAMYQAMGAKGLMAPSKHTQYSSELKLAAVQEYLAGNGSLRSLSIKYGLRSKKQLSDWIMKYNGHEELKSSGNGGKLVMTKGRKTIFEERFEIVKYCIEHGRDYGKAADEYSVSYQQACSWVKKYDQHGIDGLVDRRGKRKPEEALTELERLISQNKLLEAKNKRLEMENDLLKKIQEIERGRY